MADLRWKSHPPTSRLRTDTCKSRQHTHAEPHTIPTMRCLSEYPSRRGHSSSFEWATIQTGFQYFYWTRRLFVKLVLFSNQTRLSTWSTLVMSYFLGILVNVWKFWTKSKTNLFVKEIYHLLTQVLIFFEETSIIGWAIYSYLGVTKIKCSFVCVYVCVCEYEFVYEQNFFISKKCKIFNIKKILILNCLFLFFNYTPVESW